MKRPLLGVLSAPASRRIWFRDLPWALIAVGIAGAGLGAGIVALVLAHCS